MPELIHTIEESKGKFAYLVYNLGGELILHSGFYFNSFEEADREYYIYYSGVVGRKVVGLYG